MSSRTAISSLTSWNEIRDDILRIERECFDDQLQYSESEFIEDITGNDARFLVLHVGDRIEGFVNAAPLHRLDYLSFDERFGHEDTLYIIDVAVSRAFRNRGYGSLMLAHLVSGGEFRRYTAHAMGDASRALFLRAGFREAGEFVNWMGGRPATYMVIE